MLYGLGFMGAGSWTWEGRAARDGYVQGFDRVPRLVAVWTGYKTNKKKGRRGNSRAECR